MTIDELFERIYEKTCKTCLHRERWENYVGRVQSYCGKKKSSRTNNGHPRVKVTDAACGYYEEETAKKLM